MLNARGGFESDLTIMRLAAAEFFILTGSAQTTRDFAWIERAIGDDEHAALVDVTSAFSVLSVMGPKAEALLAALSPDDLRRPRMPFSTTADDRRRPRARARGADELRRRPRLRALRADRPVRHALRRAVERAAPNSASGTPATTRSTRCASRPGAARGARSCRPTRRPGKRASATRSSWTSRRRSSAATPCCDSRPRASQAPAHVHVRRPCGVPMGRRADPDGWQERRRADLRGLQPPARLRCRHGLRARRRAF